MNIRYLDKKNFLCVSVPLWQTLIDSGYAGLGLLRDKGA